MLIDVDGLLAAYHDVRPDPAEPDAAGRVRHVGPSRLGARGHLQRGATSSPSRQAICRYRERAGHRRPAVPRPRHPRAVRAGAAHGARGARRPRRRRAGRRRPGPRRRPVISHAILGHNRGASAGALADGIVITPSHNPPEDGGFKYNPPSGGPADTNVTKADPGRGERAARGGPEGRAPRRPRARRPQHDYIGAYVDDLAERHRPGRDPRGRGAASAPIPSAARASPTGRRSPSATASTSRWSTGGRPDLPLHAGRPRRQDPHGLLVALRDGRARRASGPLRRRVRRTTRTPTGTASSPAAPG